MIGRRVLGCVGARRDRPALVPVDLVVGRVLLGQLGLERPVHLVARAAHELA